MLNLLPGAADVALVGHRDRLDLVGRGQLASNDPGDMGAVAKQVDQRLRVVRRNEVDMLDASGIEITVRSSCRGSN